MTPEDNFWKEISAEPAPPALSLNWIVTFSDLMAIMLSFFVMMFSMSSLQTEAWKSIVNGLSDELAPGRERALIETLEDARPLRVLEPKGIDLGYLEAVISEKFRNHPILANARIIAQPDRISIALPVGMLFQAESALLTRMAPAALDAIGRSLGSIKNRIEVHVYVAEGDRDALSSESRYASAWDLALSRAVPISSLLVKGGVSTVILPVGHTIPAEGGVQADDLVELVIREMDSK